MLKRKKKAKDNFFEEKYLMKDIYDTNLLVVGNLEYISSEVTDYGPMVITTKQKYIFEIIQDKEEIKYKEVFTGFIATDELDYFYLPYVVNIKPIKEEILDIQDKISKLGLLLTINDLNFTKTIEYDEQQPVLKK